MKLTLIFIGSTGAGPVYSLEMAKALSQIEECELQVIVSDGVGNLEAWKTAFADSDVQLNIIKAYNRTKLSVFIQFFNYYRKLHVLNLIMNYNPDVLYVPFGLMWSRFIYSLLPKRIKIVSTIHDVRPHDRFNLAEKISGLLTIGARKYVDGYVILNQKDKPLVEEKYKKPVTVIPHASFSYYFNKHNATNNHHINYRIGFFGRIEPYKGIDLLVDAFEKSDIKNLRLLIAGSGSIDPYLKQRILNNERIELINRYIADDEFQPFLDSVDFVVLPYKRASQSGVIPMCFAYGKTVIATNVGALIEQVPKGTGIITEAESCAICKKINYLYENENLILEYGHNAKQFAEEELSWHKSAELLFVFFNKLCSC